MAFFEINGVGKEPSYAANPTTFDTGTINEDIAIGSTESHTITITPYSKLIAVWVSISRNEAGGVPFGNIAGGKVDILLDGKILASYSLPSSNDWGFQINETIPLAIDVLNSQVVLTIGADSGTSYNVFLRMRAYTIPV